MEANKMQIGGDHYKGAYQHWDLVWNTKMPYLEGNATKYVSRWRKKNGLQDLEKAKHYVIKLLENLGGLADRESDEQRYNEVVRFIQENNLPQADGDILICIGDWDTTDDLRMALVQIDRLIENCSDPKFREDRCEWRQP